ncbi:MAG: hypothetical protein IJP92_03255 [Lachnospiraceae bacterium]|nr:hypothetical protein [Lachnospiraceae bacterium]
MTFHNWYVVQVRTGHEDEVVERCKTILRPEYEEDVFSLKREKEIRRRGEWKTIKQAAFPGYVFFLTTDIAGLLRGLKTIPLFTKLLRYDREITPLREEEAQLFDRMGGKERLLKISIGYKDGDDVGVLIGPLAMVMGKIIRQNRHNRVAQVEITMCGEPKRIWLGLKELRTKTEAQALIWSLEREEETARRKASHML